jgi:hypothetical protein
MRDLFEQFLIEIGLLPLNAENNKWNAVQIDHTPESCPKLINRRYENSKVKQRINYDVPDNSGVYVYLQQDGSVLYIGETINLAVRLINHYEKSYKPCENPENLRWHKLFGSHREWLVVFYFECNNLYERQAIEAMLTRIFEPKHITTKGERR